VPAVRSVAGLETCACVGRYLSYAKLVLAEIIHRSEQNELRGSSQLRVSHFKPHANRQHFVPYKRVLTESSGNAFNCSEFADPSISFTTFREAGVRLPATTLLLPVCSFVSCVSPIPFNALQSGTNCYGKGLTCDQ
jgi:hypothetical protein